jgi:hypothetical protein
MSENLHLCSEGCSIPKHIEKLAETFKDNWPDRPGIYDWLRGYAISLKRSNGSSVIKIAALFVQDDGCYFGIDWVDPWSIQRDARLYNSCYPVVAHPPCQLWGKMARVNFSRWGGEHNRPGNDNGCFKHALDTVNRVGGVLEHPAQSYAFAEYEIVRPRGIGWQKSGQGYVCEVWQSAYGHRANKATWLYYVGKNPPHELIWDRPKGECQVGFQDQRGKSRNKPTLSKREANATPIKFRDELLKLAINSQF